MVPMVPMVAVRSKDFVRVLVREGMLVSVRICSDGPGRAGRSDDAVVC